MTSRSAAHVHHRELGGEAADIDRVSDPSGTNPASTLKSASEIRAELIGSNKCSALGLVATGYEPVFAVCRALLNAGHDPNRPLHAYRRGLLALVVRTIGWGAGLTVEDDRHGRPRFRRWRDRGCGAASHVVQTHNGLGSPSNGDQQGDEA